MEAEERWKEVVDTKGTNRYIAKAVKKWYNWVATEVNSKEAAKFLKGAFERWGLQEGKEETVLGRIKEIPAKIVTYTIRIHGLKMLLFRGIRDKYKKTIEYRRKNKVGRYFSFISG